MIDCHCHLADHRLFPTYDAVTRASRARGVRYFVMGGVSPDEWQRQRQIAAKNPDVLTCFGLHPVWVAERGDFEVDEALAQLQREVGSAVAIGETGLDFRDAYKQAVQKERQERVFRAHLDVAFSTRKPLVLHVVHAHEAALSIVGAYKSRLSAATVPPGMVHGFTGSREIAGRWLDLGFLISLGTRILFKQNQKLRDLAAWLPVERILVESDAPDQPPPDHPGRWNEPWTTMQVIAMIAAAKNMDADALQDQIMVNAGSLFGREFRHGKSARS